MARVDTAAAESNWSLCNKFIFSVLWISNYILFSLGCFLDVVLCPLPRACGSQHSCIPNSCVFAPLSATYISLIAIAGVGTFLLAVLLFKRCFHSRCSTPALLTEPLLNSIQQNQLHTPSILKDESDVRDSIKNTDPTFSPQEAAGDSVSAVPDSALRYFADNTGAELGNQLAPIFGVDKVRGRILSKLAVQFVLSSNLFSLHFYR